MGDFENRWATPQLDQNFKPTRIFWGQFFYLYLSLYVYNVEYILKRQKLRDPFDGPSNPSNPLNKTLGTFQKSLSQWYVLKVSKVPYPKLKHKSAFPRFNDIFVFFLFNN